MTRVITRFPPEPSGSLHIGHIKAMEADFNYAKIAGGECILRLDDTNPDTESTEFVKEIIDACDWLGYEYSKITYTSDYFNILHQFAFDLIDSGNAYVCHLKKEDRSAFRRDGTESPHKHRPSEESFHIFSDMSYHPERLESAENVLRLKTPDGADPIAYRMKSCPHFRTGSKWTVYPSYDMSHCIIDSIEGITHSFRTREFYEKRQDYFWLLDILNLRKPFVYEFGRLNIEGAVTSKRKIRSMLEAGMIESWDDPRLFTVSGLRRRGCRRKL